jgi:hypothetical protein
MNASGMIIDARPIRVEHARAHRKYSPLTALAFQQDIASLISCTPLLPEYPASKLRGNITKESSR